MKSAKRSLSLPKLSHESIVMDDDVPRRGASNRSMDDLSAFMEAMAVSDFDVIQNNFDEATTFSHIIAQVEGSVHSHHSLAGDLTVTDNESVAASKKFGRAELIDLWRQKGKAEEVPNDSTTLVDLPNRRADDESSRPPLKRQKMCHPRIGSWLTESQPTTGTAASHYDDIFLKMGNREFLKLMIEWWSSRSGQYKMDMSERLPPTPAAPSDSGDTIPETPPTSKQTLNKTQTNRLRGLFSKKKNEFVPLDPPPSTPSNCSTPPPYVPEVTPESQLQPNENLRNLDPTTMERISIPREPNAAGTVPFEVTVEYTSVAAAANEFPCPQKDLFSPSKKQKDRIFVDKKDITKHDVLCGREIAGTDHPGNLYYYQLADEQKEAYQATNKRASKKAIRNLVIEQVMEKGRFINESKDRRVYYLLTKDEVVEKVRKYLGSK